MATNPLENSPIQSLPDGRVRYMDGTVGWPQSRVKSPAQSSNPLASLYNWGPMSRPASLTSLKTQTLPNGGGSYNPAGQSTINPAPINTGVPQTTQNTSGVNYDKYRDPKTGNVMTPEEYAIYLGNKVPKGNGEISNYAGNAMTNPDQSANELTAIATNLNNSRNDIATGTTDPYKIGNQSGIAYSPAELKAIENAYAGVYDPALNDVFSRLADKKKADEKLAAREEQIFATNENIRQWKATTGTKTADSELAKDMFTQTQLNTAARNAGVSVAAITDMDPDLVNFFVAPPTGLSFDERKVPMNEAFESWFDAIENGDASVDEVTEMIMGSSLLPEVKTYFIDRLPLEPEEKDNWFEKIWKSVKGFFS